MIKKSWSVLITQYFLAILLFVFVITPFVWMFITSIAYPKDIAQIPLQFIPSEITFERYLAVFTDANNEIAYAFRVAVWNSLVVAFFVTIISLVVGTLASYAFARLRFFFREQILVLFLFTLMVPPIVFVIPLYVIFKDMGMLNMKITLILLYLSFSIPFIIWVMQSYFASMSKSFEDAAAIDGCTRMQTFLYVFLPMVRPGLVTTGILAFLLSWDEFFMALNFTQNLDSKTISVAIAEFNGKHTIDYGMIATGGILASIPPLVIAFLFQKHIITGMTHGGVKE